MPADGGTGAIIHLPISRLREKVHEAHAVRWLLGTSSTLVCSEDGRVVSRGAEQL